MQSVLSGMYYPTVLQDDQVCPSSSQVAYQVQPSRPNTPPSLPQQSSCTTRNVQLLTS